MYTAWISFLIASPLAALKKIWLWLLRRRTPKLPARAAPLPEPSPAVTASDRFLFSAQQNGLPEPVACPACRREFTEELRYCLHDASPLVPQSRASDVSRGMFCPQCRRGFEPGVRACPHDAEELVSYPVFLTICHAPSLLEMEGLHKICPLCTNRYEGMASFCGRDGAELVLMN